MPCILVYTTHRRECEDKTNEFWPKTSRGFRFQFLLGARPPFLPRVLAGSKREIKRRELPGSLFTRNLHSPANRTRERERDSGKYIYVYIKSERATTRSRLHARPRNCKRILKQISHGAAGLNRRMGCSAVFQPRQCSW